MKRSHSLNPIRLNHLVWDLIFVTIAVLLLAHPNPVQSSLLQTTQPQTARSELKHSNQTGWWIALGIAGGIGCIELAIARHRRRRARRKNDGLYEIPPEEDTYFG